MKSKSVKSAFTFGSDCFGGDRLYYRIVLPLTMLIYRDGPGEQQKISPMQPPARLVARHSSS